MDIKTEKQRLENLLTENDGDVDLYGMNPTNFEMAVISALRILEVEPPRRIPDFKGYPTLGKWYKDQEDKLDSFLNVVAFLDSENRKVVGGIVSTWALKSQFDISPVTEDDVLKISRKAFYDPEKRDLNSISDVLGIPISDLNKVRAFVLKESRSSFKKSPDWLKRAFEISSRLDTTICYEKFTDVWPKHPDESNEVKLCATVISLMISRDIERIVAGI